MIDMKIKNPCRKFVLFLFVIFFVPLLSFRLTYAQQEVTPTSSESTSTITGGDDFDSAEELTPGSYEGDAGIPSDTSRYFKISGVRPGEQLVVTGDFEGDTGVSLFLYNEGREKIRRENQNAADAASLDLLWLPGSEKSSYTYYIEVEAGFEDDLASYKLEIEKISLFDGGAESDAGDSYDGAVPLTVGSYTGYITGKHGSDNFDFYSVDLKKGQVLIVTVTPPSDRDLGSLAFYDSSRELVERDYWPNKGAVVEMPLLAEKADKYFIEFENEYPREDQYMKYDFDIAIKPLSEAREYFEEDELPTDFSAGDSGVADVNVPTVQDVGVGEAQGLFAKFTQGINMVLVVGVGVVALAVGFVLGFLAGKLLSGGKKKEKEIPQVEPQE